MIACDQNWVRTFAHTATLIVLPIITFVITKVISGNIALSLGMVGALSIVRFRNPVKSPFELSVYFAAITMGITASVSLNWLLFLVGSLTLGVLCLFTISKIFQIIYGESFFHTSFSEGNSLSTLELTFVKSIPELDSNTQLISRSKLDQNFYYALASSNFLNLQELSNIYSSHQDILEFKLNK